MNIIKTILRFLLVKKHIIKGMEIKPGDILHRETFLLEAYKVKVDNLRPMGDFIGIDYHYSSGKTGSTTITADGLVIVERLKVACNAAECLL